MGVDRDFEEAMAKVDSGTQSMTRPNNLRSFVGISSVAGAGDRRIVMLPKEYLEKSEVTCRRLGQERTPEFLACAVLLWNRHGATEDPANHVPILRRPEDERPPIFQAVEYDAQGSVGPQAENPQTRSFTVIPARTSRSIRRIGNLQQPKDH